MCERRFLLWKDSYFIRILTVFMPPWNVCFNPSYRDRPVAVCGDPEKRHGIVVAKNYIAKAFGVNTGDTVWQAKKKCPDLALFPSEV